MKQENKQPGDQEREVPKESAKDVILKKHLTKYYFHKGRNVNDDDILPVSRIKPLMDEYAQLMGSQAGKEQGNDWSKIKVTFTDCWTIDERIPADGRWLANINHVASVAAPTKEEAFEQIIISIKFLIAHNSEIKLPASPSNQSPPTHTGVEGAANGYASQILIDALTDIKNWNGIIEEIWGDPGSRAIAAIREFHASKDAEGEVLELQKTIKLQHEAMVTAEQRGVEKGLEESRQEIIRLKVLISGQAYSIWKGCDSNLPFDEWNKLFISGNNL